MTSAELFIGEDVAAPAPAGPPAVIIDRSTAVSPRKQVPRPARIIGDLAYIPLTKGLEAVIDVCDLPIVRDHVWTACDCGNGASYAIRRSHGTLIPMHRAIMGAGAGDPRVDHRDRDSLNNRRSNLRFATSSQNNANSKKSRSSACGFRGVSPNGKGWKAKISVGNRSQYIGHFDSPEAAAVAYDAAARKQFGEFAIVNFPERK